MGLGLPQILVLLTGGCGPEVEQCRIQKKTSWCSERCRVLDHSRLKASPTVSESKLEPFMLESAAAQSEGIFGPSEQLEIGVAAAQGVGRGEESVFHS